MSYYDTRLGIVNNWASPSTFGWSAIDNDALNSVFTNFFNKFSVNSAQTANNADLSTISNPFSFGSLASGWSFPQTNWSLASTSSGGDWFSNAFGSLGSWGSLSSPGGGYNSGPVQFPSFISQKNVEKIKTLDPDMQKALVELLTRAHAKGIDGIEVTSAYRDYWTQKRKFEQSGGDGSVADPDTSQHVKKKAVDLNMNKLLRPDQYAELGRIWRDEMGFTYGMDFKRKRERWHFDLRPDIRKFGSINPTNKGMETTWLGKGGQPSYASGGSSSPWSGYGWSMPSFSSSLSGFGSGFGGSWFNTMFSSSLGGWGGGYSSGISSTRALPSQYQDKIQKYCDMYGGDAKLVSCMIHRESTNKSDAVSPMGAEGLMQLMPDTARALGVTNPKDPDQNIDGGVRYINKLIKQYKGDIRTALAAYNWGPLYVNNLVKQYGTTDYNVIGPYVKPKTQRYIKDIMDRYNSSGGGGGYSTHLSV